MLHNLFKSWLNNKKYNNLSSKNKLNESETQFKKKIYLLIGGDNNEDEERNQLLSEAGMYNTQQKDAMDKLKKASYSFPDYGYSQGEYMGKDCVNEPTYEGLPEEKLNCSYEKWKFKDKDAKTSSFAKFYQDKRRSTYGYFIKRLCREDNPYFCRKKDNDGYEKEQDFRCLELNACNEESISFEDAQEEYKEYLKGFVGTMIGPSSSSLSKKSDSFSKKKREQIKKLKKEKRELEKSYKDLNHSMDGESNNQVGGAKSAKGAGGGDAKGAGAGPGDAKGDKKPAKNPNKKEKKEQKKKDKKDKKDKKLDGPKPAEKTKDDPCLDKRGLFKKDIKLYFRDFQKGTNNKFDYKLCFNEEETKTIKEVLEIDKKLEKLGIKRPTYTSLKEVLKKKKVKAKENLAKKNIFKQSKEKRKEKYNRDSELKGAVEEKMYEINPHLKKLKNKLDDPNVSPQDKKRIQRQLNTSFEKFSDTKHARKAKKKHQITKGYEVADKLGIKMSKDKNNALRDVNSQYNSKWRSFKHKFRAKKFSSKAEKLGSVSTRKGRKAQRALDEAAHIKRKTGYDLTKFPPEDKKNLMSLGRPRIIGKASKKFERGAKKVMDSADKLAAQAREAGIDTPAGKKLMKKAEELKATKPFEVKGKYGTRERSGVKELRVNEALVKSSKQLSDMKKPLNKDLSKKNKQLKKLQLEEKALKLKKKTGQLSEIESSKLEALKSNIRSKKFEKEEITSKMRSLNEKQEKLINSFESKFNPKKREELKEKKKKELKETVSGLKNKTPEDRQKARENIKKLKQELTDLNKESSRKLRKGQLDRLEKSLETQIRSGNNISVNYANTKTKKLKRSKSRKKLDAKRRIDTLMPQLEKNLSEKFKQSKEGKEHIKDKDAAFNRLEKSRSNLKNLEKNKQKLDSEAPKGYKEFKRLKKLGIKDKLNPTQQKLFDRLKENENLKQYEAIRKENEFEISKKKSFIDIQQKNFNSVRNKEKKFIQGKLNEIRGRYEKTRESLYSTKKRRLERAMERTNPNHVAELLVSGKNSNIKILGRRNYGVLRYGTSGKQKTLKKEVRQAKKQEIAKKEKMKEKLGEEVKKTESYKKHKSISDKYDKLKELNSVNRNLLTKEELTQRDNTIRSLKKSLGQNYESKIGDLKKTLNNPYHYGYGQHSYSGHVSQSDKEQIKQNVKNKESSFEYDKLLECKKDLCNDNQFDYFKNIKKLKCADNTLIKNNKNVMKLLKKPYPKLRRLANENYNGYKIKYLQYNENEKTYVKIVLRNEETFKVKPENIEI